MERTSGAMPGRRRFLEILVATPFAWSIATRFRWCDEAGAAEALFAATAPGAARRAAATPDCNDGDEPTPRQTEGPFYTPDTPRRTSLREAGMGGTPIVVTGFVVTRSCKPVPGALLDFWHADGDGEYDNQGFRCRGHQFADDAGRFALESVIPGLYPGRTRHFHVKVQPRGGRVLTTQLYFPGETRNQRDGLFRPELLMAMDPASGNERKARFNFVLDLA